MTIIRAFATGTKALYRDVMKMREIHAKHHGRKVEFSCPPMDPKTGQVDFPMTREELLFVVKTKKDLLKMLPTVILFFIPFLGYFVPLIAFMYPHRFLSSHFLTDQHKAELMASAHQKSLAEVKVLTEELKKRDDNDQLADILHKASAMFSCGQFLSDVIDQRLSTLLLKNVNKASMEGLLAVWEMDSWLPFVGVRRQRRKLIRQLGYIYTSDWLMKLEGGVDSLSHDALSEVCRERKLDVDLNSTEDMKKKLDIWMKITTTFEECPEVIMAHLPAAQYLQSTRKHY